jgi:hypothetical protein
MSDAAKSPEGFIAKIADKAHPSLVSFGGGMIILTVCLKFMGVDIGQPIQTVTDAYAQAIAAQADGMLKFSEATQRMEALINEQRKSVDEANVRMSEALTVQGQTNEKITVAIEKIGESIVALETRVTALEKNTHASGVSGHKAQ